MAKNLLQNSCDLVSTTPVAATNQLSTPFGMQLIKKQTLTSGSTIGFTNLAQYPFSAYFILISGSMSVATDGEALLYCSINNGTSYGPVSNASSQGSYAHGTGAPGNGQATSVPYIYMCDCFANGTTESSYINASIYAFGVGTANLTALGTFGQTNLSSTNSSNQVASYFSGSIPSNGGNINALQFSTGFSSPGTFGSVSAWLYGIG